MAKDKKRVCTYTLDVFTIDKLNRIKAVMRKEMPMTISASNIVNVLIKSSTEEQVKKLLQKSILQN